MAHPVEYNTANIKRSFARLNPNTTVVVERHNNGYSHLQVSEKVGGWVKDGDVVRD